MNKTWYDKTKVDATILEAIRAGKKTFSGICAFASPRIPNPDFPTGTLHHAIDRRLQMMRRSGKLEYRTRKVHGQTGWFINENVTSGQTN